MVTVAAINVVGTRVGGGVQVAGTAIKLGALALMIAAPFVMGQADPANLRPVWPERSEPGLFRGFMLALISVLWAYDGWVNAGAMAEDIEDPGKNVPRALLLGDDHPDRRLSGDDTRLPPGPADRRRDRRLSGHGRHGGSRPNSVNASGGTTGSTVIALIVMSSIYIALNGNAMSGPRAYFAMARDGLFPASLCEIHPRFKTPANSIIVQTVWAVALMAIATLFKIVDPPGYGHAGLSYATPGSYSTRRRCMISSVHLCDFRRDGLLHPSDLQRLRPP